jgi:CubicO group peptidase (beta-lactamase class C family)
MLGAAHWTARLGELASRARVPGAVLGSWSGGQEILAAHGVLNSGTKVPVTLPDEAILHRAAVGHRSRDIPVQVWGLPRSIGPAGLITAPAGDLLTFARLHLDRGVTADGTRLISPASAAAMQVPGAVISGTRFVLRSRHDESWMPLSFGRFGDGTPYIYLSGRVTPRVR